MVVGASVHDGPTHKEWPRGDVTGFDVRTGKRLWTFRSIPEKGDFGLRHLERRRRGVYRQHQRVDDDVGRRGARARLPALRHAHQRLLRRPPAGRQPVRREPMVALDARTGNREWHFQAVHHGVWDYDLPAAPALVDITVDGRRDPGPGPGEQAGLHLRPRSPHRRSRSGRSKSGRCRSPRCPASGTFPTQPFPSKPPAFERQGLTDDDLIDFTPELRQRAIEVLKPYDRGPLFTPPSEAGRDSAARLGGRRQLGRRGLRSREPDGCSCRR